MPGLCRTGAGRGRKRRPSGLGFGERVEFDDAAAVGPTLPFLDHAFETLGVFGGEVSEFAAVGREVVEFPGLAVAGDQFPGALAEGFVALVFPEQSGRVAGDAPAVDEVGCKRGALEGGDGVGFVCRRVGGGGEVEQSGHDVDDVADLVGDGAGLADAAGVGGDGGRRDAALVGELFPLAEGGVGGVGPGFPIRRKGAGAAGDGGSGGLFPTDVFLGAAAVVGEEHDKGVVGLPRALNFGEYASDALVHAVDLGRIDGHAEVPFLLVGLGKRVPGGDVGIAGGDAGGAIKEAHGELAFMALAAEDVPTLHVFSAVLFDVFGQGVEGPVGRGIGEVEEIGIGLGGGFADHADGVIGEGVGHVKVGVIGGVGFGVKGHFAAAAQFEVAGGAGDEAEVAVEAAVGGPVGAGLADVPFAGHECGVAGGFEGFGEGDRLVVEIALVGGEAAVLDHVADAGLVGVAAGEQGGAGGAAAGAVVELGEADAAIGEFLEVGGGDFAAVGADVGVAEVVGEDDDEVRAPAARRGGGGAGEERREVATGDHRNEYIPKRGERDGGEGMCTENTLDRTGQFVPCCEEVRGYVNRQSPP